ncbi:Uncharacterised protein [uncultured archaeon]|nr:Uncharacterised protein [uncultured archaeon]
MSLNNLLTKHIVDSTAMINVLNPVMAALEISPIVGMSSDTSFNARKLGTLATYGGLGFLYSKGRGISKKLFGINESSEKLHDTLYTAGFFLTCSPVFYLAAGSRDLKEIVIGTLVSVGVGFAFGGATGYTVDAFRDFTGIEESERLPSSIKKQNSKMKKGLVALVTAASIGAVSGIYSLNNYLHRPQDSTYSQEVSIESSQK